MIDCCVIHVCTQTVSIFQIILTFYEQNANYICRRRRTRRCLRLDVRNLLFFSKRIRGRGVQGGNCPFSIIYIYTREISLNYLSYILCRIFLCYIFYEIPFLKQNTMIINLKFYSIILNNIILKKIPHPF